MTNTQHTAALISLDLVVDDIAHGIEVATGIADHLSGPALVPVSDLLVGLVAARVAARQLAELVKLARL